MGPSLVPRNHLGFEVLYVASTAVYERFSGLEAAPTLSTLGILQLLIGLSRADR